MRFGTVLLILLVWSSQSGCQTLGTLGVSAEKGWYENAPRCEGYVSKDNCDDGDSVLFAGLLCLAEVGEGCETVKDSQDQSGRFWRSPRRNPGNLGKDNSFSRDQSLGVLAYLVATKDQTTAKRWWRWVTKNRPCLVQIGNSCRVRGLYRFCKDDTDKRCTITPTMFQMMYKVWTYIGLVPSSTMKQYRNTPRTPFGGKGYVMHLEGVKELIRQKMGQKPSGTVCELIEREPTNPFFMYLNEGKSDYVIDRYTELCPTDYGHHKHQWAWERRTDEQAWEKSMLWDCVFMDRLE